MWRVRPPPAARPSRTAVKPRPVGARQPRVRRATHRRRPEPALCPPPHRSPGMAQRLRWWGATQAWQATWVTLDGAIVVVTLCRCDAVMAHGCPFFFGCLRPFFFRACYWLHFIGPQAGGDLSWGAEDWEMAAGLTFQPEPRDASVSVCRRGNGRGRLAPPLTTASSASTAGSPGCAGLSQTPPPRAGTHHTGALYSRFRFVLWYFGWLLCSSAAGFRSHQPTKNAGGPRLEKGR